MSRFFDTHGDRLSDKTLLVEASLVGGDWISTAASGKTFDVTNPATGELIATLPDMGVAETRAAIDAAEAAQKDWAAKTGKERGAVLRKWFDLMVANADDLAAILVAAFATRVRERVAQRS